MGGEFASPGMAPLLVSQRKVVSLEVKKAIAVKLQIWLSLDPHLKERPELSLQRHGWHLCTERRRAQLCPLRLAGIGGPCALRDFLRPSK